MIYSIEFTYLASTVVSVEANDEGEALAKAREIAEDTDASMFIIGEEHAAEIQTIR